jgi:nucleolar protein 56
VSPCGRGWGSPRILGTTASLNTTLPPRPPSLPPSLLSPGTLIGETVAARLIAKAGSLTSLAKSPASTIQILGAEKALFRALKTKGNTPKYGLIYHSSYIGRAAAKNKGRISRYLANKCSIASRIDTFAEEPTTLYGEKLKEQVEERLRFYDTGAAPRKNVDVMNAVRKELEEAGVLVVGAGEEGEKKKKKKKKEKKREEEEGEEEDAASSPTKEGNKRKAEVEESAEKKKKKKKKEKK